MTNENYKKERKITKFSILSIFFALLLLLGTIIGISLSIKKISKNAHESSEFTDSINYRMRVTLSKDENDKIDMAAMNLIAYTHGEYFDVTNPAGFFGWSVRKKKVIKRERK